MQPFPARNRLVHETSPYLLQHADNPVDWYPWGEEAFALARREARPILLSVGYAACHWCHVMERESFASAEVAAVLNAHYVCIKVDREERPDVDAVYMAATQAMNAGRGGWPMTVLLTPELQPFFAGTYLPPHDRGGALGFLTLLRHVAELWRTAPERLREDAASLTTFVQKHHGAAAAPDADPASGWVQAAVDNACTAASADFDATFGGFGAPPKFLATPTLRLLLRRGYVDNDSPLRPLVTRTLHGMARGGLWDWLAGGFSRYSTDAAWLVPHFEKMAYDNASMAQLLLEAHQATGDARWGSLAAQTLQFVARELTRPEGAFASAIDADSEGEEGRFYTWGHDEVRAVLRQAAGDAATDGDATDAWVNAWSAALGVREEGNWEAGRNVLHAAHGLAALDARQTLPTTDVAAPACTAAPGWPAVRAALHAARARRVRPVTDDKVLAGHNGLLIEAFARGAAVLGDAAHLTRAQAAADFVWAQLWRPDGLRRSWRDGCAKPRGMLEDYAYLARGLIALYEAGAPATYFERACRLADRVDPSFADPQSGALYDSPDGERNLLFRPRTERDGASPSPAATMVWVWRRLAWHRGGEADAALAERTVRAMQAGARRHPEAHVTLLANCLDDGRPAAQLAWLGAGEPLASPLWRAAHAVFLPHVVFAHGRAVAGDAAPPAEDASPLLAGRPAPAGGGDAVYVCAGGRCSPPLTSLDVLAPALAELAKVT